MKNWPGKIVKGVHMNAQSTLNHTPQAITPLPHSTQNVSFFGPCHHPVMRGRQQERGGTRAASTAEWQAAEGTGTAASTTEEQAAAEKETAASTPLRVRQQRGRRQQPTGA